MNKNIKRNHFETERDGSLVVNNIIVCSPCADFTKADIARLVACANFCADVSPANLQKLNLFELLCKKASLKSGC